MSAAPFELEIGHARVILKSLDVRIELVASNHANTARAIGNVRSGVYTSSSKRERDRRVASLEALNAEREHTLTLLREARLYFAGMIV